MQQKLKSFGEEIALKSLKNAIDVLNCFTTDTHLQGVSEIARKLDMNKSKVSRILSALNNEGVVVKTEYNQKYRLGLKILDWAEVILSKSDLRNIAQPYMEKLRLETQESVHLWIIQDDQRVCIEGIQGPKSVFMNVKVGHRFPLYAGATGKVLLAFLPSEEREKLLAHLKLTKLSQNTITNRKKLANELISIRQQGYAKSFEERVDSGASIACPILNDAGEAIAAISIDGLVNRFTQMKIKEIVEYLKIAIKELSEKLGSLKR